MKGILQNLAIENTNRHLNDMEFNDKECIRISREIDKKLKKLSKMKLTGKQSRAVDELLTLYNEDNSWCCKLVYMRGFTDCVSLLKEIGVI